MMGGRGFILLKSHPPAAGMSESGWSQPYNFAENFSGIGAGEPVSQLPPDMANSMKVVYFVIQFTVTGAATGAVSRNEKARKSYQ
jgi:hypothetical protein